jgi:thiamine-monophosphate kinase
MSETSNEFDIISKYFTPDIQRTDVSIGVGDDCAVVVPPEGKQLATTVDTLVAGVHFPNNTSAEDIAYKSIAVSISDLAAMGATPAWLTLALTMPDANSQWLQSFAKSFGETAKMFELQLIGGDTTRGPLSVTVQATGFVEPNHIMRRDSARPGDSIYVTGSLGDASLGLKLLSNADNSQVDQNVLGHCLNRLNRPVPRIEFGCAVAEYCTCAIDISDGLVADLGHILKASHYGAEIIVDTVPISTELRSYFDAMGAIDWEMVISGGDDYELCLVIAEQHVSTVTSLAESMNLPLTRIGAINLEPELRIMYASGESLTINKSGYRHF